MEDTKDVKDVKDVKDTKDIKIYNYDEETKEFLGSEEAERDSLGKCLLPNNATYKKPKSRNEGLPIGYINIFDEVLVKWIQVEDHRQYVYEKNTGKRVYNKSIKYINSNYTLIQPSKYDIWDYANDRWKQDEEAILADKKLEITRKYIEIELQGMEVLDPRDLTKKIKMDYNFASILKLSSALDLNNKLGRGSLLIRTFDNESINISNEDLEKIIKILGIKYQEMLANKWEEQDSL